MNTQSLKCDRFTSLTSISTAVECYMSTRGGAQIDKLLSLSSSCTIEGSESLSGEAIIRGKVCHRAIYLDENGALRTMDYVSDFSTKYSNTLITPTTPLVCVADVVDSEVSTRSDSEIKVTSAICIQVYAILSSEIEILGADESIIQDLDTIQSTCLVGRGSSDLISSEEVSVGENISNILLIENNLVISSSALSRDKVTVNGEVYSTVTYDNDGKVKCKRVTIPFSEEIFVDGAMETDEAFSLGYVKNARINLSGEGQDTTLEVECSISLKTYALRSYSHEVVRDCFSTDHTTTIDSAMIPYGRYLGTITHSERLEGVILSNADAVASTSIRNIYLSSVVADNTNARVEGVVDIDAVYTIDGIYSCSTLEIPFAIDVSSVNIHPHSTLLSRVCVADVMPSIKNGRIEVSIDAFVSIAIFEDDSVLAVKEVSLTDDMPPLPPLMLKRIKPGESMWEVCKQICASSEDILAQNPDLSLPLRENEIVKYYRRLEV
ncbi:MAG: DUF3794 domain-containing protein [Clostridia bacterium]|nr:DUF3794 domain-containing protein [Clostridia bacterium]